MTAVDKPLKPDLAGSRPFSYPLLVQPVLDKNCVACHTKSATEGKVVWPSLE